MEKDYLQVFLNNESKILSLLIKKLLKSNLKGDFFYYYEELIYLLNKVEQTIDSLNENVPFNYFFNLLIAYEDKIDLFTFTIKKYSYKTVYNNKYIQEIKNKNDIKFISFIINNELIENKDKKNIYEYFIKCALYEQIDINYETFKNLILSYVKKYISFSKKTTVTIGNKELISKNRIVISNDLLKKLYEDGNYEVLFRIFYAINNIHLLSVSNITTNSINELSVEMKDYILANYMPSYLENNEETLSYKLRNEIYALYELTSIFSKFEISYDKEYFFKLIKEKEKRLKNEYRAFNDQRVKIDKIFNNFIMTNTLVLKNFIENVNL